MLAPEAAIWMLRRLSRMPAAWLITSLGLALWPLVVVFSPLTLTVTASAPGQLALEAGWVASLLAMVLAVHTLDSYSWLLGRGQGLRPQLARLSALATAGTLGHLSGLLGALLFGGTLGLPWGGIGLATLLSLAHLTVLAWWVLLLPLPSTSRSLSLVVLAWGLPALAPSSVGVFSRLSYLLETQHVLPIPQDPTLAGWARELLPIGALALAALLTPPVHASFSRSGS